jgi:hypothetical protein
MPDSIRRVDYYYAMAPDKPGEAARILGALSDAGVNLLAFTGFPHGGRRAQLDFMPENAAAFLRAARKAGLKLSARKTGFLIHGNDRPGALAAIVRKLGAAGINVTAVDAVCAGGGRYGALLWVKQPDLRRAAKVLGAS